MPDHQETQPYRPGVPQVPSSVVALAGRRIDAAGQSPPRFPLAQQPIVRQRISDVLATLAPAWLVSSAACGADLIALLAAGDLGIARRVILTSERQTFRTHSVVDRPGHWGPLFDTLMDELEAQGNVVILDLPPDAAESYARVNEAILDAATRLAEQARGTPRAVVVWEGQARGSDDLTAAFAQAAEQRGMPLTSVSTI